MNVRPLALGALLTAASATMLPAQHAQCVNAGPNHPVTGEPLGGDACQKAVDLFSYMMPQLGTLVAGGSATLGQGSTLGGPGHFAISLRANALPASIPNVDEVGVTAGAPEQSSYTVRNHFAGLPSLDASVGIFKGLPLLVTNVGGVDLLASVSYLREFSAHGVDLELPDGSIKIGYGARVGLLQESLVMPGVSFTLLKRDLPRVSLTADAGDGQTIALHNFHVSTTAWRVVVSKSLLMFGLAAGYGKDRYRSGARLDYSVSDPTDPVTVIDGDPIDMAQDVTRTNMFLDVSMNLIALKLIGQIGRVTGGEVDTFNQFSQKADAARMYGAVGFRFGL